MAKAPGAFEWSSLCNWLGDVCGGRHVGGWSSHGLLQQAAAGGQAWTDACVAQHNCMSDAECSAPQAA